MNKILSLFNKKRGFFVVFGGFLIHLSMGSFYSFGNIQSYVISYMNESSLSRGTVNNGNVVWILGLIGFGIGTAVSAGGLLADKIGSPLTVLVGGWIMSFNVAMMFVTIKTYLSVVVISYGLLSGIGAGLAYGVAFGAPCKWFPDHKGLVIGIVISGFAISAPIFDLVQSSIIQQPINLKYLPISFVVLGTTYACLQFLGSILIKDKPKMTEDIPTLNSLSNGFTQLNDLFSDNKSSCSESVQFKPHQLILDFDFWILWLTMLINCSSVLLFTILYGRFSANYFHTKGVDKIGSVAVTTLSGLCNFSGRILWGYLMDRKSYKLIMLILILPQVVLLGTLGTLSNIENPNVFIYVFTIWISLIIFLQSGNFVVFPTISAKLYGMKYFISNYGILFTSASLSAAFVSTITNVYWDLENENIFYNVFIIAGSMLLISAGLTSIFRGRSLIFK